LAACGSTREPRAMSHRERLETACGNLHARLTAVADTTGGLRDPQPAMLTKAATEHRLRLAVPEALAVVTSMQLELSRLEPRLLPAIQAAERAYRIYPSELPRLAVRTNPIRLNFGLVKLESPLVLACFGDAVALRRG
jgi:hypothetical protein